MIWRGRSTYRPRPSRTIPPPELIGPMLEPNNEEPQQEEPPAESRNPTPGQEREDQGAAEIQVRDLEADLQKLSQSKTGGECGDGPDVQGKILPKSEEFKMLEGDDRQPQS
ncbi:X antigen family member 3 [Callithrix jacchus]|uniref:X antigen family member 3 n=1 Tax=Callithrix jacchus TaxID=9483 RepID=H9KWM8_CALJA|nr:X antigen family member 3 [Callithrix jacchus]XP_054106906.1 X antigen family member 3 [Callithrix jacchus]